MQIVSKLINTVKPTNYKLTLDINKEKRIFSGNEIISAIKTTGKKEIRLHSKDLTIKNITINNQNCDYKFDKNDELIVETDTQEADNISIEINFEGKITDGMHGMYPCYFTHENEQKELIATQFESHHAREVFPCIDEPEAKATYDLTLITENNITVLSNSNIEKQYVDNDRLVTTFETTPKMSSYLLAWVYGDLQKKSTTG